MSLDSWFLIFLVLFLLFPFHTSAEAPDQPDPDTTLSETVEETEAPPETEETEPESFEDPAEPAPVPTVAPFDFVLLEESSVKAVERLDQLVDILTGMMFFLGVCSGILFFKVLTDKVHV